MPLLISAHVIFQFSALFLGETKVSEEKKSAVNEALAWLERFLHGRKWLAGDSCTIADVSTYATVSSLAVSFVSFASTNFK